MQPAPKQIHLKVTLSSVDLLTSNCAVLGVLGGVSCTSLTHSWVELK